jgi:hypothetical protein
MNRLSVLVFELINKVEKLKSWKVEKLKSWRPCLSLGFVLILLLFIAILYEINYRVILFLVYILNIIRFFSVLKVDTFYL